ncbi:hypothetical protein CLH62_17995 [Marinobacter guineae]|uniref:EAL domain-containing protein n=2 Tax=Marinobacter guineae TaxID=432303 RepID=A0A2G1VB61_9GAMM|nr:hypothetical protein CLH62_17995 [Marinobacter guineae]
MAHKLGIQVIGKGVETAEQIALLKEAGCDFAHGHYFSTPLPMEKFSGLAGQLFENPMRVNCPGSALRGVL